MNKQITTSITLLILISLLTPANAAKLPEQGDALTIYNDNFAVIRHRRQMDFEKGVNTKKFTDVASRIDPTSVNFLCLSSPGAISILEQNYEYDLVNTSSLLKRYIDKDIKLAIKGSGADPGRSVSGTLTASRDNNLILKTENDGLQIINKSSIEQTYLSAIPEDLVTKPTLVWLAESDTAGPQLCQVTYTTAGINWKADYSAVLNADETKLDFSGWVTIDNKSGAAYKDAAVKLIAGDVKRVTPQPIHRRKMYEMDAVGGAPAFEEKAFMEYHLYTLGRKTTVNNNQVKQIEFIDPAIDVPAKKIYIYKRQTNPKKVQVKFEFENKKENSLGIALPKGKVRVFKKDPADDMLEFVGEDAIDHTARNEKLTLYIGNAFDIVPEYTLTDKEERRRFRRESHKIELRNRKDTAVTVLVDEKFPQHVNWTIDQSSHKHKKRNANTARFEIKIAADSTTTLEYTATQTW